MNKRVNGWLIATILVVASSCIPAGPTSDKQWVKSLINTIGDSLAPDKRIALIDVNFYEANNQFIITGETSVPAFKTKLTESLAGMQIDWIDSLTVLPDRQLGAKTWGLVTLSVANLRGDNRHSSELVTQAILGTPVRVLKRSGSWLYVQTPDKYLAWTNATSVELMSDSALDDWKNSQRFIFTDAFGTLTAEPGESKNTVSDLVMGSILTVENQQGNYYLLSLPDGRSGFIEVNQGIAFNEWKATTTPDPINLELISKQLLGLPYLWGGTSSKGVDCSRFVKTLYFMNGMVLHRDASQQVHQGIQIDTDKGFEKLEKGDLLFFGRKASDKKSERITHVGMYLNNGRYIHSSGRVKINSFNPDHDDFSQYLLDIFVRAKRIINSKTDYSPTLIKQHPWY